MLVSTVVLLPAFAATVVPVTPGPPNFSARYESPIYAPNGERGGAFDHYGARWFDFWKDGTGFAHIPGPTEAKNCVRADLHFCISLAEFTFAAPLPEAKLGATWRVGNDVDFRLIAVSTARFRNRDIKIYTIKGDTRLSSPGPTVLASIFSYSFEWGVLGYAEIWSENYDISERRTPINLEKVSALVSQHGLGGRENCRFWKCNSDPNTR